MYRLMHRLINAKYSLPAWEWVLLTLALTGIITLFAFTNPPMVEDVVAFLPFEGKVWGPIMVISCFVAMYGMAWDKIRFIRYASFICFMGMIFLDVSWWVGSDDGYLSVLVFNSWITLFWAYKYLASYARERDQV